ncbi:hypothetical protein CON64_18530 [Bacillus pseudomycoides]|nr:hypothetical protein CON64_18530 [Bacillus pseudomycoides]
MSELIYPTLYEMKETNFSHNGLGILKDAISCNVIEERNGIFELELKYPVSSPLYKDLMNGNIIKARANENLPEQLFRIVTINPNIDNTITVFAQHITYDLLDNFVENVSVKDLNASAFLDILTNSMAYKTPFVLSTDIDSVNSTSLENLNPLQALAGIKGSFIDTWGGEFERDNFNFRIKKARGFDNGVLIAYKKNLIGLDVETDIAGLATRLYPFAKIDAQGKEPEKIITLPEKYVDSPYINNYPFPKIIPLDLSEKARAEEGKKPSITNPDELRKFARKYLEESKIDIPKTNVKVEFIPLWLTEEYKNFAVLERVGLGDIVTVRHEVLGVDIKVKVIRTEFNSLTGQYNKIELGNAKANFNSDNQSQLNDLGNNLSNQIKDQSSNLQQAIDNATNLITGADGGYIRLNPKEKPSEILIMDKPEINKAQKIWRWNMGGLGYSSTGYNGKFGTAMTQDGRIVADFITAGTLDANQINVRNLRGESIVAGDIIARNNTFRISLDRSAIDFYSVTNKIATTISQAKAGDGREITSWVIESLENQSGALAFGKRNKDGSITQSIFIDGVSGDLYSFAPRFYSHAEINFLGSSFFKQPIYFEGAGRFETSIFGKSWSITNDKGFRESASFNPNNSGSGSLGQRQQVWGEAFIDTINCVKINGKDINQTFSDIGNSLGTSKVDIQSLQGKTDRHDGEISGARTDIHNLQIKTDGQEGTINDLRRRIEELEKKVH